MKFRPLLHQLQQTLGEDVTEEVKVALIKVEKAMQDLTLAVHRAQPINKPFSSPCSMDEVKQVKK